MGRKAEVRYWESRGGYCCWHNGSQKLLAKGPKDEPDGPTYLLATKKWSRLVSGQYGVTVSEVVEKYLEWESVHREANTTATRASRLRQMLPKFGDEVAVSLKPYEVQAWCDQTQKDRGWSNGTATQTIRSLRAALNWAKKGKLIPFHPLEEMEMLEGESRGLECVLSQEQVQATVDACKWQQEREFVEALRDTGARPSEIFRAEARHYDPAIRALVYEAGKRKGEKSHKTGRTGKARIVYLAGQTEATVQRLLIENPTGPLFRRRNLNKRGDVKGMRWGWCDGTIYYLFTRLKEVTGIPSLIPYSFRHTFAVRWLRARKPIEALAEVLGTSIAMIQKHYGHLAKQHDYLRSLVDELHGRIGG